MPTAPDLAKSVVLTLSAVESSGANIPFPKRQITFTKDRDVVPVGRSSKIATKGFVAGTDNAWFDSPVMSRLHAQLGARMDDNKIEIKDVGSLHGTFLNGRKERLPTHQWHELKDGDTITFGAPIWHSNEHFLPIGVKVGLSSPDGNNNSGTGASGTGTFQVPDDSDDDGASDDGQSSGTDDQPRQLNGHNPAVQNGPARIPAVNPPVVDLTTGHDVRRQVVVDLSSPCGSPIQIDDDDDFEDEELASRLDSEHGMAEDVADGRSISPELEEPLTHENPGGKTGLPHLADILSSSQMPDVEERHGWYDHDDDEDVTSSLSPYSDESEIDYPDEEESDSEMAGYDEAESECDDDMDEAETEEDYSPDEGSLELDSPYDRNHDPFDDLPESLDDWEYPEIMPLVDSLSRPAEPSLPVNQPEPSVDSLSRPAEPSLPVNQPEPAARSTGFSIKRLLNKPQSPVPAPRQVPNQAAQELPGINSMTRESTTSTARDVSVLCFPAAATPAAALGAKTGKTEFFQAREQNKIILNAQKTAGTRPTSSVHALCNKDEPVAEASTYRFGPAAQHTETSSTLSRFPPILERTPPIAEEAEVLFSDTITAPSPILTKEMDASSRRTHVNISDIVDTQQHTPNQGKLKRKAEEISETTEEQELWAAKTVKAPSPAPPSPEPEKVEEEPQQQPPQSTQPQSTQQHTEPEFGPEPEPKPLEVVIQLLKETREEQAISVASSQVPERPLKRARMMRVAERLGYAALGGVTAGAMIVGTLIYTAPTFG